MFSTLHLQVNNGFFAKFLRMTCLPMKAKLSRRMVLVKEDAINDDALKHFQEVYSGNPISKDDLFYYIYGILHSQDYRTKYANNLSKELPRIPRVATYEDFKAFSEAGRKLADLHVNFEKQPRYKGVTVQKREGCSFRVTQMKWGKIAGKTGNAAKDKTRLIYNEDHYHRKYSSRSSGICRK